VNKLINNQTNLFLDVSKGLSLISSAAPIPPNLKASSTASSLTMVTTSSPVITPINFCSLSTTPAETKLY
jgi:hypothetical protein